MKSWTACALLALWLMGAPLSAQEKPSRGVALNWVRLPGAETCVAPVELAGRVERRLGRPVFVRTSDAIIVIEGRVGAAPGGGYGVQRYVEELKRVRPNNDNVIFSVVAGVPAELVADDFRGAYDLSQTADAQRYYDDVLAHPSMQEQVVDPGDGTGHVLPSCTRIVGKAPPNSFPTDLVHSATPPRRLVEVARGFGANAVLGSLCQDEFGTTIGHLIRAVGEKMSGQAGR